MINIKSVVLFIAVSVCTTTVLISQEDLATVGSLESLRQSIDRLDQVTEQSIEAANTRPAPSNTTGNSAVLNLSNLVDSLSKEKGRDEVLPDLTPDDAGSTGVKDILYKLDLLTKLKAESKSKLEDISPATTNPLRDLAAVSDSEPSVSTMPITETPTMKDPAVDEALPARPQESTFTDARSVIPGPINPFEMGNSLFQTGKIATALDAYETVDMENMSVFDAAWLRYMKATCHRQLGNQKDADRIYREISKEKNVRVLVDSAQWWLKQSDRTRDFEAQLEQLQSNLDIMDERSERIENQ